MECLLVTSRDGSGISVTLGATAPAPPSLLILKTCQLTKYIINEVPEKSTEKKERNRKETLTELPSLEV